MRRSSLVGFLVAAATACGQGAGSAASTGTPGGPTAVLLDTVAAVSGTPFALRIGQSARIGTGSVILTLRDLREDSRCPVGVQCVSAGNAQIVIGIRTSDGGASQAILNLTANTQFPSAAAINGIEVRFQALTPSPQAGSRIARASYIASFVATGPNSQGALPAFRR